MLFKKKIYIKKVFYQDGRKDVQLKQMDRWTDTRSTQTFSYEPHKMKEIE
jgi:hypothetical protein